MENELREITALLDVCKNPEAQMLVLDFILGHSSNEEGLKTIQQVPALLDVVVKSLGSDNKIISKHSSLILINLSANDHCRKNLLKSHRTAFIDEVLKHIIDASSSNADACCIILSNLTQTHECTEQIVEEIFKEEDKFNKLLGILTKVKYNKDQKLYYLGSALLNLTQSSTVRNYILTKDKDVVKDLLSFTTYMESSVKRHGIVGILRNCCFETGSHAWLLSEEVDILPSLLLPLAGNTQYDEEDNDKLPIDLQYMPENKTIEEDPEIRCMLLEALTQLCALRVNREYIRSKNVYIILRDLHKCEKDPKVLIACENLVDILIRTEEEIGEDNLKGVEVPEHLRDGFMKVDAELRNESE